MAGQLGSLLTLLRESKGLTQNDVADRLCRLSGQVTVTRTEVSRWEREERVPSDFWLGWLSNVLEVAASELEEARARSKGVDGMAANGGNPGAEKVPGTKWRDYARSIRERSLALVTLRFEHRATSVQLNGTYEEPEQATAAIGMFRQMVTPPSTARTTGEHATTEASTEGNAKRSSTPGTTNGGGNAGAGAPPQAKAGAPAVPNGDRPAR